MNPQPSVPPRRFLTIGTELGIDRHVVHGYVSAHYTDLPRARPWLRLLREKFRLPTGWRIEAPVIFDPAARQRVGLGHLDDFGARTLVTDVIDVFNRIPCLWRFAYLPLRGDQTADNTRDALRTVALDVPPDGTQGPPAAECDLAYADAAELTPDAIRLADLCSLLAFVSLRAQACRPEDVFFQQQVVKLRYWSRANTVGLLLDAEGSVAAVPATEN